MPVQLFRRIRIVMHIHNHRLSFLESQQRPGKLSVISDCRHDRLLSDVHGRRPNPSIPLVAPANKPPPSASPPLVIPAPTIIPALEMNSLRESRGGFIEEP